MSIHILFRHKIERADPVAGNAVKLVESGIGVAEEALLHAGGIKMLCTLYDHVGGDFSALVRRPDSRAADAAHAFSLGFLVHHERSDHKLSVKRNQDFVYGIVFICVLFPVIFRKVRMRSVYTVDDGRNIL